MATDPFHTFAREVEGNMGKEPGDFLIEVACDASLDESPILRTNTGPEPSMAAPLQYFLNVANAVEADILYRALDLEVERLVDEGDGDGDDARALLDRVRRLYDYLSPVPAPDDVLLVTMRVVASAGADVERLMRGVVEVGLSGDEPVEIREVEVISADTVDNNSEGGR